MIDPEDPHTREQMKRALESLGLPDEQRLGPPPADPDALELAKLALASARVIAVEYRELAAALGLLAQRYLVRCGVNWFTGPSGLSITCVRCGRTSHHPKDVAERYCGECHRFLDSPHDPR